VCVAQSVCEPACPSGQHCEQGVCLDDVCSPACGALQRCVAGVCQDLPCEPACAAGTHCQGGACVEDDCLPACPAGQHCQTGLCHDNVCDPVCLAGETCLDPAERTCACGANPSCPANQRCVDGACQVNDRCIDGADNDQDGWTDAADPDCLYGTDEVGFGTTSCNDGQDNDQDGVADAADPGCTSAVADEGSAPWTYVPASLSSCLLDMACPRVAIESHMGDWSLSIPGNSMAAFEKAYQDGAQAIESDIRVSADGVPFMIHNDQITAYESVLCAGKVVSQSPASEIADCLLAPSLTEKIPTFDEFVEWARGKIMIHLDVKDTVNVPVMVQEIIDHNATDYVFIAVSTGEVLNVLPTIPNVEQVYFVMRVGSVADIDLGLTTLRRPNVFMFEGDRTWEDPPVDEAAMQVQVQRVHDAGVRIMASSDQYLATVENHQELFDMGFDVILSYNTPNGVTAARNENAARGVPPQP
jgi:hypothetical protein